MPRRADVEVARADVLDWSSLYQAFAGLDAVYYLVHAMGQTKDFERADRTGAHNTRVAAEEAGVIIGSGSASFEMLRHLVEVLPVMVCPRWSEPVSQLLRPVCEYRR